jgi:hypothetical protein
MVAAPPGCERMRTGVARLDLLLLWAARTNRRAAAAASAEAR